MTEAEQITHLKAQLAEAHKAIRELNERASSHLITMMNTVQRLKLENDVAMAKLRGVGHYKILIEADKSIRNWSSRFFDVNPQNAVSSGPKHFRLGEGCKWVEMTDEEYKNGDWVTVEAGINPLASTQNQS